MPYIGKQPIVGNFQVCDAISVVNGQAAYTMQVNSTNVTPETAFHMLVSLNGVLQKPGSSFTISGSTITFASNLATGDVIDFIILLGDVLNIGAPSDDTVTASSVNNDFISGQTALSATPDDTDEFLVSDAGTIKRVDYSLIKGGGITMAQQWRLSADFTGNAEPITSNLEIVDTYGYGTLGSDMSVSSGIWTFPSTGYYLIMAHHFVKNTNFERGATMTLNVTTDGSNFNQAGQSACSVSPSSSANTINTSIMKYILDVTDTSTHKVSFGVNVVTTGSTKTAGDTNFSETTFTFIRLGDT